MADPNHKIIGRKQELALLQRFINGKRQKLFSWYGPGGIGKSSVGLRIEAYARRRSLPVARIEGDHPDLTHQAVLYRIMEGVAGTAPEDTFSGGFRDFEREHKDYLIVQEVLKRGGGLDTLFDVVGNLKDPLGLIKTASEAGKALSQSARKAMDNREGLDRYLNRSHETLTEKLAAGLEAGVAATGYPAVVLVDSYEHMEGLDGWFCDTLLRKLPEGVKVILLGRNALPKINRDWNEYGDDIQVERLEELNLGDTRTYLVHHGLSDAGVQEKVYRFTGGYPLLLVLVTHLAREVGGWGNTGVLEIEANRDEIASRLLERILQEERVEEVRAFLERGAVAPWFDPEIIQEVLEVDAEVARHIYDKLRHFSFVERHPRGLCFHEKVREMMLTRLRFGSQDVYTKALQAVQDYMARMAGLRRIQGENAEAEPPVKMV